MARANAHNTVFDEDGEPLVGAEVRVYENRDTGSPIAATMYDAPSSGSVLTWPLTTDANGFWSFYLDAPQQVTLVISYPGKTNRTVHDVHVSIPGNEQVRQTDLTAALAGYLTSASAAATYATLSALASYLTSASAAATYATIASLSSYLTSASAAATYATLSAAVLKSLFTAAGDMLYATGSATVARLAAGTARQMLVMNAGATAPEWFTPPFCSVYHSADQSISSGSIVDLEFNSEDEDSDAAGAMHDNATNNTRITIRTAGVYDLKGAAMFEGNATGSRAIRFMINGSTIKRFEWRPNNGTNPCAVSTSMDVRLAVNDYVTCQVYQDSGSPLNVTRNADYSPRFSAAWKRP
ncbi:MAG: carboxypeptidase-like regulatory domain-containing protein [Chloroflexota bacterium]